MPKFKVINKFECKFSNNNYVLQNSCNLASIIIIIARCIFCKITWQVVVPKNPTLQMVEYLLLQYQSIDIVLAE